VGINKLKDNDLITVNDIVEMQSIISPNHPMRKLPGTVLKNQQSGEVIFTPPQHHDDILSLFSNLEVYINDVDFHAIDPLIKMPIIHYQFESIHPFYDGNGRTGRLLNMLYLVQQNLLEIPVLYLSSYIIRNKSDYYRLLQEVRTMNSWEEWIVWMLNAVEVTSKETIIVVNKVKQLMDAYKIKIRDNFSFYSHDLINCLFKHPYTKIDFLEKQLSIHRNTAGSYLRQMENFGLLKKVKIGRSNYYINIELLNILKNR
jgi:Fic family protein